MRSAAASRQDPWIDYVNGNHILGPEERELGGGCVPLPHPNLFWLPFWPRLLIIIPDHKSFPQTGILMASCASRKVSLRSKVSSSLSGFDIPFPSGTNTRMSGRQWLDCPLCPFLDEHQSPAPGALLPAPVSMCQPARPTPSNTDSVSSDQSLHIPTLGFLLSHQAASNGALTLPSSIVHHGTRGEGGVA